MTLRDRLLAEARCNFTPDLVGGKCGDCGKKLKETDDVFWFRDEGESVKDVYVGLCCADKRVK